MKLKYTFEIMELDDRFIAVPVGENAINFHGVLKMNSSAMEIIDLLINDISEDNLCLILKNKYQDQIQYIDQYIKQVLSSLRTENLLDE